MLESSIIVLFLIFFRACIKNRGQSSMEATSFEKKKSVHPITFTARWTLCTGSANQKIIRLNLHSAIFANLLFTSLHLFPLSMVQSLSCLPAVSHLASFPCALNLNALLSFGLSDLPSPPHSRQTENLMQVYTCLISTTTSIQTPAMADPTITQGKEKN